MNENLSVERLLAAYMAEDAASLASDRLVDDVLSATSRIQPDARWLAILKEPPLRTQSRVVVGTSARRLVLATGVAALLLIAIAAVIVGANVLRPPRPAADDWPMFRGDSTHAGLVLHGPTGHPVVNWQYQAPAAVTQAIAIVGDLVYVPTDDGHVMAIGRSDGLQRWSAQLDPGPSSGLIVADGLVLVRDGEGVVHGLDARTGAERWRSTGRSPGGSNASLGAGAIYLGSEDGDLVAFDTDSGAERWREHLGAGGAVNTSAYADGLVYIATAQAGFIAVDARNGAVAWRFDTGDQATGTPVVADGIAYIGAGVETTTGHLWALDAKTGKKLWQTDEAIGSPSLADGVGYANEPALGKMVAFDEKTGAMRWRVKFPGGGTTRAPVIADGIVYVPQDGEHRIYALDALTGGELWHFDLDSGDDCCLAVAKGAIFVGTSLGTVYDIGGDGAVLAAASIRPVASNLPTSPSPTPLPVQVKVVWTATPPDHGYCDGASIGIDPAGRIWVPDVANSRFSIISPDGMFLEHWGTSGSGDGEFILHRPNGNCFSGVAFVPDGSFFVLDTGNLRVQKFDAQRTFVKAWGGFGSRPGQYVEPAAIKVGPDGNVYVLDDVRGVLESYDPSGKVLGSLDLTSNALASIGSGTFGFDADGNVYVSQSEPNQVAVFDPTGRLLRTFGNAGDIGFLGAGQIAVDQQGRVFVTQGDPDRGTALGVLAFDRDGRNLGGFGPIEGSEPTVQFPAGMVFDGSANLILEDAGREDGSAKGRILKIQVLPPLAP